MKSNSPSVTPSTRSRWRGALLAVPGLCLVESPPVRLQSLLRAFRSGTGSATNSTGARLRRCEVWPVRPPNRSYAEVGGCCSVGP